VTNPDGRAGRIGTPLNCAECDRGPAFSAWPPGIWLQPSVQVWSHELLNSYARWTGRELIHREGTPEEQAGTLFFAPPVVVSHGLEPDPILNYGNRTALMLWETTWADFLKTPSRATAEPANRVERERMLARAAERGFVEDYRGVRISSGGRRFHVQDALVWNVMRSDGERVGQAATFSRWTYLDQ
jgi:hypothetical protein